MYKVTISVLKRALNIHKKNLKSWDHIRDVGLTLSASDKKTISDLKKSVKELKFYLGEE